MISVPYKCYYILPSSDQVWNEEHEAASQVVLSYPKAQLYKYTFATYRVRCTLSSKNYWLANDIYRLSKLLGHSSVNCFIRWGTFLIIIWRTSRYPFPKWKSLNRPEKVFPWFLKEKGSAAITSDTCKNLPPPNQTIYRQDSRSLSAKCWRSWLLYRLHALSSWQPHWLLLVLYRLLQQGWGIRQTLVCWSTEQSCTLLVCTWRLKDRWQNPYWYWWSVSLAR